MATLITILHVGLCLFLIIVVLLQPGKGGDVSAAFGGGGSQTVFGARGATTFLQKMTSYCAILYMATTISLTWMSSDGVTRGSVIDDQTVEEHLKAEEAKKGAPATTGSETISIGPDGKVTTQPAPAEGAAAPAEGAAPVEGAAPEAAPAAAPAEGAAPAAAPAAEGAAPAAAPAAEGAAPAAPAAPAGN